MISKHAAFAKVRARIRREISEAEESEHEGGELNLVPYLDIVTNVVMFLLATSAASMALGNINVSAPRYSDPQVVGADTTPDEDPKKKKLNLTVVISYKGFIVGGAGGMMEHEDGTLPTIKCASELKKERCPAFLSSRINDQGDKELFWMDRYDYKELTKLLKQIKEAYKEERRVILSADRYIPYQIVVKTMDTLRGQATVKCTGIDGCFFDQVILSAGVK